MDMECKSYISYNFSSLSILHKRKKNRHVIIFQYIKRRILIYLKTKYYLKWRPQCDYDMCHIATTSFVTFDIYIADDKEWFS
jgi:hypothetical protein